MITERYRDRWLLVVDKPCGLPTQGTRTGEEGLYEQLRAQEGEVFLHHRLDQPASGLVLFALHSNANKGITEGLRGHTIERRYRAMLYGTASAGWWTGRVDGKAARTEVRVESVGAGMTAVALSLETGRKHQLRVQAALQGTPILGDRRYGGDAGRAWPRLALHAAELRFRHPVTGEAVAVSSPLPDDLQPLWERHGGKRGAG